MMDLLIKLMGRFLEKGLRKKKNRFMGQVSEAIQEVRIDIRNIILKTISVSADSIFKTMLGLTVLVSGVVLTMYGLALFLEAYFQIKGSGQLLIGLFVLMGSLYTAQKYSLHMEETLFIKD